MMREIQDVVYFLLHLYDGLPLWSIFIFIIALVMILISIFSVLGLAIRGTRHRLADARSSRRQAFAVERGTVFSRRGVLGPDDYLWVFVVPALNEEVTIADSVGRLAEVEVLNKVILVINDGSTDDTAQILSKLSVPELTVLERVPPLARQGKSEALNDAWRYLHREVLGSGRWAGWSPGRVIVTIVDADGRLDRQAGRVARQFVDARVGGVQTLVRIYNRHSGLTWGQDLEFGVFGRVYQLGRAVWGTANMGGNGQFNRLSALDSVAEPGKDDLVGPWRASRLTEDQDIGLRMIHRGWRGSQTSEVSIDQQGLNSLRLLYRQRTRWAQGGWQVLDLFGATMRNPHLGLIARLDQLWYLLTPVVQSWVGLSVVLSIAFFVLGIAETSWTVTIAVLFYLFTAGPGIVSVLLAQGKRGIGQFIVDILLAHLYLIYSWLIYPVVYRALIRQMMGVNTWTKTQREAIER
jgi:1,2-diacylglycerol 3-beta-glucosyltransferase